MKKRGLIDTMIKVGIAAAAVGGTLYILKDKIEENPKYKEAVDKVKDTIKKYVPDKEETPEYADDLFDEDFDEIIHTSPSTERGYVNIKLHEDEVVVPVEEPAAKDAEVPAEEPAAEETEA